MKIFVFNEYVDNIEEFDDTEEGLQKALVHITDDHDEPEDAVIIRGERMKFVPPSSKGQIIIAP